MESRARFARASETRLRVQARTCAAEGALRTVTRTSMEEARSDGPSRRNALFTF
jgi:hypothetical protein